MSQSSDHNESDNIKKKSILFCFVLRIQWHVSHYIPIKSPLNFFIVDFIQLVIGKIGPFFTQKLS